MERTIEDAIGIYNNVFEEGFCEHLISEFEANLAFGVTRQKSEGVSEVIKKDTSIFLHERNIFLKPFNGLSANDVFWQGIHECMSDYLETFSILKQSSFTVNTFKVQKTERGGGYHVWHSENTTLRDSSRFLTYMLYLNTLPKESNGETEFLYQERRIAPTENTMVLWPAGFTHPHRGNPVYGDTPKYIVTGWFNYC